MYVYTLIENDGGDATLTVFAEDGPLIAHSTHPNFTEILTTVVTQQERDDLVGLFDISVGLAEKYNGKSDRVSIHDGAVYVDGEIIHNTLTEHILRSAEAGVENLTPYVKFLDKLQANPSEHSRQMLWDWLQAHEYTLTAEGDILGYKGVQASWDEEGNPTYLRSIHSGTAAVNGVTQHGHIDNSIGSVVEMPRYMVEANSANGCSYGLHVGTYKYANGFAQGALLECHVNPADVVSVPTDCNAQKMRCCRYTVVNILKQEILLPVVGMDDYEDEDDEFSIDW